MNTVPRPLSLLSGMLPAGPRVGVGESYQVGVDKLLVNISVIRLYQPPPFPLWEGEWSGQLARSHFVQCKAYCTQSVFKVVFQKSIPILFRQLILCIGNSKGQFDRFVGGWTSTKRL